MALVTSPADREEWQDCVLELGDDFSDLEELQVVCVQGADRSDRAVIRIVGKFFPAVFLTENISADLQSCNPSEEETEKWFNQYQVKTSSRRTGSGVTQARRVAPVAGPDHRPDLF
ncbi:hypothetical protein ZWY2020_008977 [Hordeum vulgare]|nr:hypothetical protein ZWY2020_008977 [Hordeum vulgare]